MSQVYYTFNITSIAVYLLWLTGCSTTAHLPDDPRYAPVTPAVLNPPPNETGSLFKSGYAIDLWQDQRARRVGDVLTVVLSESTSSSKSSSTSLTKNYDLNDENPSVLGRVPSLSGGLGFGNSANGDRNMQGETEADQSNSLSGNITVTVSEVRPNGILVIRGEKWLNLTKGSEFIRLTGLVRPADIRENNSIASQSIADARITYSGTGELSAAHNIGWASRFFNSSYWPF